jgi:hypothetical protein
MYQYTAQLAQAPTRQTCNTLTLMIILLYTNAEQGNIAEYGTCNITISDHNLVYVIRKHCIARAGTPNIIQTIYLNKMGLLWKTLF